MRCTRPGACSAYRSAWTQTARSPSICATCQGEAGNERIITCQHGAPGRRRRHRRELSAGERTGSRRRGGHQGLPGAWQHRSGHHGDGADRRRTQLHRRRRYSRFWHEPAAVAIGPACLRRAGWQRKAGRRRHPWLCSRWRAGDRDGLPLSDRIAKCEGGTAGSADRHFAGRWRYAASAAADRRQGRARLDCHRPARAGRRSAQAWHHRRGAAGECRSA